MKMMERLKSKAPFLAEMLNHPGGYASAARKAKFHEHRRSLRLRQVREELCGRPIVLQGPAELLERLLRQDFFTGLDLRFAVCPESTGELCNYLGPSLPIRPMNELLAAGPMTVLNFTALPSADSSRMIDLADENLGNPVSPGAIALERHLQRRIAEAEQRMAERFLPDRTVLFAGNIEYFNFLRVSEVLRTRGWRTFFLGLTADTTRFKRSSFDLCLQADGNLEIFLRLLNAFPFRIVHIQGWMENHAYAAAAALLCDNPLVVELNDLPHYFLEPREYDALFGNGHFAKEEACLKIIAEQADGLLANCRPDYFERLLRRLAIKINKPYAAFHGYPLRRFFRDEQEWDPYSIVFPGSLFPGNFPAAGFADGQLLRLVQDYIAPQSIRYHIYANLFSGDGSFERFWDYHYLARTQPLFQFHTGLPPEQLTPEISRLGFGAMFYLLDNGFKVLMDHYASLIPTKVFTMFEAGLPVIYNEEFEYLSEWADAWGLGIKVSQADIKAGIRPLIEKCDYGRLRRNVAAFRETCGMENKIENLLAIYAEANHG